jgi:hypothetical protein
LELAGVHLATYYFDRDMRRLTPRWGGIEYSIWPNLAVSKETSRLIVWGDADALIEMASGRLHTWAEELAVWPKRGLLTAKPPIEWGWPEFLVEREIGLRVFPKQ